MNSPDVSNPLDTSATEGAATPVHDIGLIIVGDEILSGKRADKHLSKTIELLGERGLSLSWARYVGDDRRQITAACDQPQFSRCAHSALGRHSGRRPPSRMKAMISMISGRSA